MNGKVTTTMPWVMMMRKAMMKKMKVLKILPGSCVVALSLCSLKFVAIKCHSKFRFCKDTELRSLNDLKNVEFKLDSAFSMLYKCYWKQTTTNLKCRNVKKSRKFQNLCSSMSPSNTQRKSPSKSRLQSLQLSSNSLRQCWRKQTIILSSLWFWSRSTLRTAKMWRLSLMFWTRWEFCLRLASMEAVKISLQKPISFKNSWLLVLTTLHWMWWRMLSVSLVSLCACCTMGTN